MVVMSFGVTVIAMNVGGASEIVVDGVNGSLLEKDFKNEALVSYLNKIIGMGEVDFQGLRKNARRILEE